MDNEKRLSFMDHLVELRRRLVYSIIAIMIGMCFGWFLVNPILNMIQKPLSGHTYLSELKEDVYSYTKQEFPAMYNKFDMASHAPVEQKDRKLNYSAPLEPFFVQMKISLIAGFIIALPVVFFQVWQFISPGLTRKEKKYVVPFVTVSTICFCLGVAFFLVLIWPVIINFSLSYEQAVGLQSLFNLSLYVNFCLRLMLMFGLIFELPVLALLLSRIGIISGQFLAGKRRYAILASSIIAAFHADLVTMFVVMIPLYFMYEVSIWVAYIFGKKKPVTVAAAT